MNNPIKPFSPAEIFGGDEQTGFKAPTYQKPTPQPARSPVDFAIGFGLDECARELYDDRLSEAREREKKIRVERERQWMTSGEFKTNIFRFNWQIDQNLDTCSLTVRVSFFLNNIKRSFEFPVTDLQYERGRRYLDHYICTTATEEITKLLRQEFLEAMMKSLK